MLEAFAERQGRRVPGLVVGAIGSSGGQLAVVGTGQRELPNGPAPDGSTLFEIGSISKVYTGLLLAIAVLRGEVSLDTPVRELLPPGATVPRREGREITLEQLSTHCAGLPRSPVRLADELVIVLRERGNPYAEVTEERLLEILGRTRLRRPPGSGRPAYSNLGAGLLGLALVRAAAASSYGELVRQRISAPLGLSDTGDLAQVAAAPDRAARLAAGYGWRRRPARHWSLTGLAGAGALLSTAEDTLRFLQAQLAPDSTGLGQAIALTQQPRAGDRRFSVGLGWIRSSTRQGDVVWHNGGTTGFRSFAGFRPDRAAAVVMLANSHRGSDRAALSLLTRL